MYNLRERICCVGKNSGCIIPRDGWLRQSNNNNNPCINNSKAWFFSYDVCIPVCVYIYIERASHTCVYAVCASCRVRNESESTHGKLIPTCRAICMRLAAVFSNFFTWTAVFWNWLCPSDTCVYTIFTLSVRQQTVKQSKRCSFEERNYSIFFCCSFGVMWSSKWFGDTKKWSSSFIYCSHFNERLCKQKLNLSLNVWSLIFVLAKA